MKNIIITINTENDAFGESSAWNLCEVGRILIATGAAAKAGLLADGQALRDLNGNKVGNIRIED